MDATPTNPSENQLPDGVTEASLVSAVEASGYPLQTIITAQLRARHYGITEEWAFQDSESGQLRTLDILARLQLFDTPNSHKYVRPWLDVLIECKQSKVPYVFFASGTRPGLGGLATHVAGLRRDEIEITTNDDASTWSLTTIQALSLEDHEFLATPLAVSLTFSKAVWANKSVTLSGADAYERLVLPLTKAVDYHAHRAVPVPTAVYFDVTLPAAVAVIDGPMVLATISTTGVRYELCPWVRVYRHDVNPDAKHRLERDRVFAVGCVHASWLEEYLSGHLEPFAREFGRRALAHDVELAKGQGFAPGMESMWSEDIEVRLRPRELRHRAQRSITIAGDVGSMATSASRKVLRRAWRSTNVSADRDP
jgi:hypothetical protein